MINRTKNKEENEKQMGDGWMDDWWPWVDGCTRRNTGTQGWVKEWVDVWYVSLCNDKQLTVILSMPSSCLQTAGDTDTWQVILGSQSTLIGTSLMRSSIAPTLSGWKQKSPSFASLVRLDRGRPAPGGPNLHCGTGGSLAVVQSRLGSPPVTRSFAQL